MMNEQALSAVLGALSTALVTAVGALAWMVRQSHHERNPGNPDGNNSVLAHLDATIERQILMMERQMEAFRGLAQTTSNHEVRAQGRHELMIQALQQIRDQRAK